MYLEKVGRIGFGAYSKIYKVRDEDGEEHAMKICLKNEGYNFGMSYREADIALKFSHPFIVCLQATFQGNPFCDSDSPTSPLGSGYEDMAHDENHLLYELAKESLDCYIDHSVVSFPILISLLSDVLLGLEYMHLSGYIHRDLRADNILLFDSPCGTCKQCLKEEACSSPVLEAKISDFGFTRLLLKHDPLTPRVNNVSYRAPECLMEKTDYNFNIDIWSLGCMIYTLVQRKRMIENPIADTDFSYLHYFSKVLPYSFPPEICRKYNINQTCKSFEEFFPFTKEMSEDLLRVSTYENFKQLLLGMLAFDPAERLTATQCLDSPFFDIVREKIEANRQSFPPLVPENNNFEIADCIERKWAMNNFRALYDIRDKDNRENWYTERILFLAFHIMDDVLVYLKKHKENAYIIPTKDMGKILTKKQLNIIYIVCLYFSIKYMAGTSSHIISFQDVYPKLHYTDAEFEYAKNFEIQLFSQILGQKIYRVTLYDKLLQEKQPTEKDKLSLLLFCINGHHKGRTLNSAYAYWRRHVDHFYPKKK